MAEHTQTLLLSGQRIAGLAAPNDYLLAMHRAFEELSSASCAVPAVTHIATAEGGFHIKSAQRLSNDGRVVIKVNGNFPSNPARYNLPTIQGFIALLDANSGVILALMDSIEITARRTAATTALATRYLAKPDSSVLSIIGCGVQARYHVEALREIVPLHTVRFFDTRDEAMLIFRRYLDDAHLEGVRAVHPADAARNADIVVTLTTSNGPLLSEGDVPEDAFIAGIGADSAAKQELAPTLMRASRVVPDSLGQASVMGDLHHAIEQNQMQPSDIHAELAAIVSGQASAWSATGRRFVFDSTGLAIQDLAAAEMIFERARQDPATPMICLNNGARPQ
jgi:ornithine cyclodeaminase/alanine dehydrogenase-like protein (mu-crystallin family)